MLLTGTHQPKITKKKPKQHHRMCGRKYVAFKKLIVLIQFHTLTLNNNDV